MLKKFFNFLLLITCFTMLTAHPLPGKQEVMSNILENPNLPKAMKLTDKSVDIRTLSIEQVGKCFPPKQYKEHKECVDETVAKMNINVAAARKALAEENTDERKELSPEEVTYLKMLCECTLIKDGSVDPATRQILNLTLFYSSSSLSPEQKSSATSGIKSCLLNGRSESTLPLFVNRIDEVPDAKMSNKISAIQVSMCFMINAIDNGCSDDSVIDNSAKTRLVNVYKNWKDKYGNESS